jgi:multidrug resistance protein MdtO
MAPSAPPSLYSSWFEYWKQDLQSSPGRVGSALRIVLTAVLVLITMMVLQIPYIAYALYVIFIVTNESPAVSLRTGTASLLSVAAVLAITLIVVIATDNDPMARVLGLAIITFLGGMITVATSIAAMGPIWGLICAVAIGFWENHVPADALVKDSLWLLAAFATGIGETVAIGYVLRSRSPADKLGEELRTRYRALAAMFETCAGGSTEQQRRAAADHVSRLAAAGHRGMLGLYHQIVDRNVETGGLPTGLQVHILLLSELLDSSAAYGLQAKTLDADQQLRCGLIARQCVDLANQLRPSTGLEIKSKDSVGETHLDRIETILSLLQTPPSGTEDVRPDLVGLPAKRVPLLIPGAVRKAENVAFALKISLCATICYLLYHAIDWPGISTSVITVMVAGLVNTGAMKQRLTFRLLGSILGGLVLGIGAEAFLFPHMDSITSLVILVGCVAFLSAWVAGGRRFGYVGLQIAFAFYLTALAGFTAPTELAPARDRFVGIVLAIVVMWFVFDQMWPVRTTTEMRNVVASVLTDASQVIGIVDNGLSHADNLSESDWLRDRLGKQLSTVRTLNDAVEYEFGVDRDRHLRAGRILMEISMTAVALVWSHATLIDSDEPGGSVSRPAFVKLRQSVAQRLLLMAEALREIPYALNAVAIPDLEDAAGATPEYARNTVARFHELRSLALTLNDVGGNAG